MKLCSAIAVLVASSICSGQTGGTVPRHSLGFLLEGNSFVSLPAGEFQMGSASGNADERPVHRVRISKPFDIARYEVTQAQWRAVMDSPHSKPRTEEELKRIDPSHFKGAELPVDSVSWDLVQEFLRILNTRTDRYVYRLPTEAEWEYAAWRGKTGESWCESNSGGRTHAGGEKKPNALGVYDLVGNVAEWVADWYAPDYYEGSPRVDPRGPDRPTYKGYRGGSWLSDAKQCRSTFRGFDFPNTGYYSVGVRLVRVGR